MKKLILAFGVIVILGLAGAVALVFTLDVNRYRPEIIRKIEAYTTESVQMGDMRIVWGTEPVFTINDVRVGDFSLGEVSLSLRLKPLLMKQLDITSVVLKKPKITIVKEVDGRVRVRGFGGGRIGTDAAGGRQKAVSAGSVPDSKETRLDRLILKTGSVHYTDYSVQPSARITVEPVDAELKDIVFSGGLKYATVRAKCRTITLPQFKAPVRDMNVDFQIQGDTLQLKSLNAGIARGQFEATGTFRDFLSKDPKTQIQIKLDGFNLGELRQSPNPYKPQLRGDLSAQFKGEARGMDWRAISHTLTGNGEVTLNNGAVTNINVLGMILGQMTRVPGVKEFLDTRLPNDYRGVLSQRETYFESLRYPVTLHQGNLYFQNLRIASPGFEIYGTGQVHLNGSINCMATLALDPRLSAMLIQGVPNLRLAADSYGRLSVPIRIYGHYQQLVIQPDMDYLISKVVQSAGPELLAGVMRYM